MSAAAVLRSVLFFYFLKTTFGILRNDHRSQICENRSVSKSFSTWASLDRVVHEAKVGDFFFALFGSRSNLLPLDLDLDLDLIFFAAGFSI